MSRVVFTDGREYSVRESADAIQEASLCKLIGSTGFVELHTHTNPSFTVYANPAQIVRVIA